MITTLGFRLLLFVTLFLVGLKAVPDAHETHLASAGTDEARHVHVR